MTRNNPNHIVRSLFSCVCTTCIGFVFVAGSLCAQGCSKGGNALYAGETAARTVGDESSAGNLDDGGKSGEKINKLTEKSDATQDKVLRDVEGGQVSELDPIRNAMYIQEGSQQVIADDVVRALPGKDPKEGPLEVERKRISRLKQKVKDMESVVAELQKTVAEKRSQWEKMKGAN